MGTPKRQLLDLPLGRIHHLIRYFILLGILAFVGHARGWQDDLFLIMVAPCIFLANGLKGFIFSYLGDYELTQQSNFYLFLLPVTLVYYTVLGFQLKQLWNERGVIRTLSLFALISFVLFIHYFTWSKLLDYYAPL